MIGGPLSHLAALQLVTEKNWVWVRVGIYCLDLLFDLTCVSVLLACASIHHV